MQKFKIETLGDVDCHLRKIWGTSGTTITVLTIFWLYPGIITTGAEIMR